MKWQKKGQIYAPAGDAWWARSYALLPTVDVIDGGIIRVYFASLDENRYGRVGYVELDAQEPSRILHESREPVLDVGEPGAFDDCGVNPSCLVNMDGTKYLYYIGWQRCERTPYLLFAGLAVTVDGRSFRKVKQVPILERAHDEPFLRSATSVLLDQGRYRCWYVSGVTWTTVNQRPYPSYVIRHAESSDGVNWTSGGPICIDFEVEHEFGLGRPWVLREAGVYKMWYSIRSRVSPYRIGYAESNDGLSWTRLDERAGIDRSESGWDSEMICYPCVVDVAGRRYMFYNGNRHGSTGFGYAVLES